MNTARIQETNGTPHVRRQDKKQDESSSRDFLDLLNSMIAFNPQSEITVNKVESTAGENAKGDAEGGIESSTDKSSKGKHQTSQGLQRETLDHQESVTDRESDDKSTKSTKSAESTKSTEPADAEKTQPQNTEKTGKQAESFVFTGKTPVEKTESSASEPDSAASEKMPHGGENRAHRRNAAHPEIKGNDGNAVITGQDKDLTKQPAEKASRGTHPMFKAADSEKFIVHADDSVVENTIPARIRRQFGEWRAPVEDAPEKDTQSGRIRHSGQSANIKGAENAASTKNTGSTANTNSDNSARVNHRVPHTNDVKYTESNARELSGRPDGNFIPHNLHPRVNPRTPVSDRTLEGMIGRAARELGEPAITSNENKLMESTPMKTVQPLTQLDRQPIVTHINRTEFVSTAVVSGMEREEDIASSHTVATPAERQTPPQMERAVREEALPETAVRTRTEKPETNTETQTVAAPAETRNANPAVETREHVTEGQRASTLPDQARQIQAEVIRGLENRKMEFRMQLQPEELGRVDIKMALQGGKLTLEIISSARASELLSKQIDSLAASIKQNSPELSSVQVVNAAREAPSGHLDSSLNANSSNAGRDGHSGQGGNARGKGQSGGTELEDNGETSNPVRLLDYAV